MSGSEIVDAVLKAAEKAAAADLEKAGRKAVEAVRNLNAGTLVNSINVRNTERVEKRAAATLDTAYLLGSIDGCFTVNQKICFEKIAAALGKTPADVSAHAIGLAAKLACIRTRGTEEEFLNAFVSECRPYCEAFGGLIKESRRAFALWIMLGLADGAMTPVYRKALELLRKEFKHSALLFGALGALPVYGAATAIGGVGIGLVSAIAGGLAGLKHKQLFDKASPLISDQFMKSAEDILARAAVLEAQLADTPDAVKQAKYNQLLEQLEELIAPPADDDDDEDLCDEE